MAASPKRCLQLAASPMTSGIRLGLAAASRQLMVASAIVEEISESRNGHQKTIACLPFARVKPLCEVP